MKLEKKKITLPEGIFEVEMQIFEKRDKKMLFGIYKNWIRLNKDLSGMHSRTINIPEGLSEGAFCMATGTLRMCCGLSGANTSFDCYNSKTKKRIQVKASSIKEDLTSFGPKSVWDELYFMDFYNNGKWDGKVDIYRISSKDIYKQKVNSNQTLKQMQAQGKRPRFSIKKEIIFKKKLKPVITFSLKK